jgi:hypothetical protein
MSIESGFTALLVADSTVNGLVAGRIYPDVEPEGCQFPVIVYQRISTPREVTLDNAADTPHARFQFACKDVTAAKAAALKAAVKNALAGFVGLADDTTVQAIMVEDERSMWNYQEGSTGIYESHIDFTIWYEE